jgi:hypothetical protein
MATSMIETSEADRVFILFFSCAYHDGVRLPERAGGTWARVQTAPLRLVRKSLHFLDVAQKPRSVAAVRAEPGMSRITRESMVASR